MFFVYFIEKGARSKVGLSDGDDVVPIRSSDCRACLLEQLAACRAWPTNNPHDEYFRARCVTTRTFEELIEDFSRMPG